MTTVVNRPPSAVLTIRPRTVAGGRGGDLRRVRLGGPRGAAARYAWDLDGNGLFERATGSSATTRKSFGGSTTLMPRVKVLDPHGGEAIAGASASLVVDAIRP